MTQLLGNANLRRLIAVGLGVLFAWIASTASAESVEYPSTGIEFAPASLSEESTSEPLPFADIEQSGAAPEKFQGDDAVKQAGCYDAGCYGPDCYGPNNYSPGQRPYCDWGWGCGGSPYRTGPRWCDNWRVGPVWDVAVDGMMMFREDADLDAIEAAAALDLAGNPLPAAELTEQFDNGSGARIYVTGTIPECVGYQLQFGYEGIPEWNAAVVFPKLPPNIAPAPAPPGGPPAISERRTVYYDSSFHSAELNVVRKVKSPWIPFFGIRYVKFSDEINDSIDQVASPPLPGSPLPSPPVITSDRLMLFDVENDLVGAQMGLRRDVWKLNQRLSIQGFVNAGVYCNMAKRTDLMSTSTTQFIADVLPPPDANATINEARIDTSTATNKAVTEISDVAYIAEASLTSILRVNKCLALRGGYQILWIDGLRMADDAYLGLPFDSRAFTFSGWHVGAEYRR